jgi:hypothetical protein
MTPSSSPARAFAARIVASLAVLAGAMALEIAVLKRGHGRPAASLAATVVAAATLLTAWLLRTSQPYPARGWWSAAGVLAVAALLAPLLTPDLSRWDRMLRPAMWMFPWFFITLATARGAARRKSGALLVAIAVVFAAILLGSERVAAWIAR